MQNATCNRMFHQRVHVKSGELSGDFGPNPAGRHLARCVQKEPVSRSAVGCIGAMERKILLILEQLEVRRAVASYTIELARRMGARVHVLILREADPSKREAPGPQPNPGRGALPLERFLQEVRSAGFELLATTRPGDCVSELLKYLVECEPFQAAIWGGDKEVLRSGRANPLRHHWLKRVRSEIGCPLVFPSLRKGRQIGKLPRRKPFSRQRKEEPRSCN